MTTPGLSGPPDGSYVLGNIDDAQNLTESSIKAITTGGARASFGRLQGALVTEVKAPLAGQAGSISNHETRITTLENGGVLTTFGGNDSYEIPTNGRIGVGIFCGGQAGKDTTTNTGTQFESLTHGGYVFQEFDCANLRAQGYTNVLVTVGAGGATDGQLGGTSSFGDILVGNLGSQGSIRTTSGYAASSSTPGTGGRNGTRIGSTDVPATAGQTTPGGPGGAPGANSPGGIAGSPGGHGQPGATVPIDTITPCGGSGGGGGGYTFGIGQNPGHGGNGGTPGACGGAAGAKSSTSNAGAAAAGGFGGNGRVHVLWTPGAVNV